jgi:protein SCO1/2
MKTKSAVFSSYNVNKKMKKSSANLAVLRLKLFAATIILLSSFGGAQAQKTEHYNSPLYAPKVYDPNRTSSNGLPQALQEIGIEQKLGEQLPLDTEFRDESGNAVKLGDYFGKKRPVVLALVYYECPMLCNQVLNGLTGSLKGISFDAGKDFDVVAVSFDARENEKPGLAENKKASYLQRYGRAGSESGWHFLTGTQASIDKLTQTVGFNYKWDEPTNQFAHGSAIMVATPEGKLSRYLYGIDYAPKDLKFAMMDSSESKIGNPVEQLSLYCYHYDPSTGRYGLAIMKVVRLGGILTLLGIGAMFLVFWRYGKNKKQDLK